MRTAVLTLLRVDVDASYGPRLRALVDQIDGVADDPELVIHTERRVASAAVAFHLAVDAVGAAQRLATTLTADGRPRIALATGRVDAVRGRLGGVARDRADAVLAAGSEAAVVLSSSTAVMVASSLPAGAELVALAVAGDERIYALRRTPAADDAGASNLGWAHRAASRPVIGRAGPMSRLEGAWTAALSGSRPVVIVSGDPGVGKTTLAAENALRVQGSGGLVLYGRWDEEVLAPYQAMREALGAYAAACPRPMLQADVKPHADDLARLLPDLGARVGGVRGPLVDDPDAERLRLFDGVRHWLGAVAQRRPVLLVLDDLQWADHSSLRLLRHLVDEPPDGQVLIVVTLRDGDVEGMGPLHALGSFETSPGIERIDLHGLDADAVAELIAHAANRSKPSPDDEAAAVWLADETAGNPLLVQEILRGLDPTDPRPAVDQLRDRLPGRVHDVVRWRLANLPPATTATLEAASILGERFSLDVLAHTLGRGVLDLRHQLDDAARAGVVRDVGDGDDLVFAHAVVRRALQDDVPADRAAALHHAIARTLSEGSRPRGTPAEIAHHYLRAAETSDGSIADVAIRWARSAADQARRETAFESTVAFLSGAVAVHDRFGGDAPTADRAAREVALELRLDLADAHDRAGEFLARDRRYSEAAELARSLDRADLFSRAAQGYGGRLPAAPASNPAARRLLDESLARLPTDDGRARALTLARLAHVVHGDLPHDQRRALADEAEAMARRLDAPVVVASVLASRVLALDGPDDVDDHLEIGAEIIRIGEQVGDPDLVLQGARARIHPLFVVAAHEAAHDLADRFTDLAESVRHPDHLRITAMWEIMWAALEGRFDDATTGAGVLRGRLAAAGHPQANLIHLMATMTIRWMRGDLAGARPGFDALDAHTPSVSTWAMRALVAGSAGDEGAARATFAERTTHDLVTADRAYQWQVGLATTAMALERSPDPDWALAVYDLLAPYSGRNTVAGYVTYLGAVDHHLGTLAATLGRYDDAATHLEAAYERHRVIGACPWFAMTGAWLANVLAARDGKGDADRAAVLWAEADALASDLGLRSGPEPHPKLG
jgi:hypothetical protein